MSGTAPYPAIDPNQLGTELTVEIDRLLIPFLLGVIDGELTDPNNWEGDEEDIQGTLYAFNELLKRLSEV